jgi:hypothetical protein
LELRVFNKLPSAIKDLLYHVQQFKLALKGFFLFTPFIVWRNILIGDKLRILVLYYSVLNRVFTYNIFLISTILQILILV